MPAVKWSASTLRVTITINPFNNNTHFLAATGDRLQNSTLLERWASVEFVGTPASTPTIGAPLQFYFVYDDAGGTNFEKTSTFTDDYPKHASGGNVAAWGLLDNTSAQRVVIDRIPLYPMDSKIWMFNRTGVNVNSVTIKIFTYSDELQ